MRYLMCMGMQRVVDWARSMTRRSLDRRFAPSIPAWFEVRRAAQVVAFFATRAGGRINILKATKLVYLADRLSMERREAPITNDTFVSMKFGPVNSYTYSYMDGSATQKLDEWGKFVGPREGNDLPAASKFENDSLDELSRADIKILDETWRLYKDIDRFDLADWTHDFCPEWSDPGNSSEPIPIERVYKVLEKRDPKGLAQQTIAERKLRTLIQAK